MKKRSLKSLKLKKESISSLSNEIKGGTNDTGGCNSVLNTICCITEETNAFETRCCGATNQTFCCTTGNGGF
ncbi:hypothetical protein GTQ40_16445 [Flavobacteriaceae bacterium R38]|nr:hypothetical protein [Flavobacteriaceae bacterium R38]